MKILASMAMRKTLDQLRDAADQKKTISSAVLVRHLERIGDDLGSYAHSLRIDYDQLAADNKRLEAQSKDDQRQILELIAVRERLEGEVARLREAMDSALALFPFSSDRQKFTFNGVVASADGDELFFSVKRVTAFLADVHAALSTTANGEVAE